MPRQSAISKLSLEQLEALVARRRADEAARGAKAGKLVSRVKKMAASAGVSIDELVAALGGGGGGGGGGARRGRKPGRPAKAAKAKGAAKGRGRKRRASTMKGQKVAAKYRHPEDAKLTWSGRGVQARWIREWIKEKKGRKLEDLAVQ